MKRIIKARERPTMPKKGLTTKRRFFKRIKQSKKNYYQINAPHNTSEYLIENNSSPFYEDDDDINVDFIPFKNSILFKGLNIYISIDKIKIYIFLI